MSVTDPNPSGSSSGKTGDGKYGHTPGTAINNIITTPTKMSTSLRSSLSEVKGRAWSNWGKSGQIELGTISLDDHHLIIITNRFNDGSTSTPGYLFIFVQRRYYWCSISSSLCIIHIYVKGFTAEIFRYQIGCHILLIMSLLSIKRVIQKISSYPTIMTGIRWRA